MGWYVGGGIAAIFLLIFLTALICFFKVFYLPKHKPMGMDEYDIPEVPPWAIKLVLESEDI